MEENTIKVNKKNDEPANRSLHGLTRTLINNMINWCNKCIKELQINGVGYRAQNKEINLNNEFRIFSSS